MMIKTFTKPPSLNSLVVCAIALLILLGILFVQSCKEDPVTPMQNSFLSVTHTSPTLTTFNLYLNQAKVNSAALPFGGTLPYFPIKTGEYDAKLTTESSSESLVTKKISLESDKVYSLFIINETSNLDYLLVNDDIKNPQEKALIRFINLSPDAPALNLAYKDSTTVIEDKAYKTSSAFVEIEPKTYSFEIKDKATGTAVKTEITAVKIEKGRIYTVISRGLINSSELTQPFSGQLITNQ